MRAVAVVVSTALLASAASAAEIPAQSRIDAVTVFPSGAEVTRTVKLKIEQGEHVLIFNDVPAQAAAHSIRVEGQANGKLEIGSVDTRRLFVPRSDEQAAASERRKIEDELDALRDGRGLLEGQVLSAETQKTLLSNLAQLPTRPAPGQGSAGPQEDWGRILGIIATGTAEAQKATQDAQVRLRDLDRKIEDAEKKLAALAPAREERTEVKVYVTAQAPLEADVMVHYQVPNASWSAIYDARLATGARDVPPKLDLTRRAAITQHTGESWDNVTVQLSTTRPTAGAAAPELFPMTVGYIPDAPPQPPARPMARSMADDGRQRVGTAGGAMDTDGMSEEAAIPQAAPAPVTLEVAETRSAITVSAPFQAIFGVPGRLSIPNTGEAKRVQLSQDTLEPALAIRTVPKDDPKAYLYAKLVVPKGSPILPGTVSLFRDGTFVGTGQLPVLAPGEEHDLGFGIDDSVRVRHALVTDTRGQSGLISSSKTDTRNFRITVKNQHARAIDLTVFDQIPASQNQDIKVERTGTTPTKENIDDKRGVLKWESKLEPDEEKIIEFGYRVSWPAAKAIEYGR